MADPLSFGQKGLAFPERIFGALAFHHDACEVAKLVGDAAFSGRDLPWLPGVNVEGTQHCAYRG
ncbi:MAG TPA: hypothetical protein VGD78_15465 [Chthoniobacterales bacterium]